MTMVQREQETRAVQVPIASATLEGDLSVPKGAKGLVLFAHGSGSSRFSPRNRFVAGELQAGGLGTLLIDLLTPEEEEVDLRTREYRFDIDLLARRLVGTIDWLKQDSDTQDLRIGCFGSSTGAAAALIAAAERPDAVFAVVSRGGRTDLAGPALAQVRVPTLFIVGGDDRIVLDLNRQSLARMSAPRELAVIPGASHLFEEPGSLDQVAELARNWFRKYLGGLETE